jgi:hypothetical protein
MHTVRRVLGIGLTGAVALCAGIAACASEEPNRPPSDSSLIDTAVVALVTAPGKTAHRAACVHEWRPRVPRGIP